jgi:hypothetical protein
LVIVIALNQINKVPNSYQKSKLLAHRFHFISLEGCTLSCSEFEHVSPILCNCLPLCFRLN